MKNVKMKEWMPAVLAAVAAVWTTAPAVAHHSAAMFDMTKTLSIEGTVKEWQFVNPHSWLQVMVVDASGAQIQWSFEGPSPAGGNLSESSSLRHDTFKPGDKISVQTHPMKDGRHAGLMGEITFADGHKWTPRRPPPPAGTPPGSSPPPAT